MSRLSVPLQIAAGFLVGIVLLTIVAAISLKRIDLMRARANEAAVLGGVSTVSRDVLARMLDEEAAIRGYEASGEARYLDALPGAEAALRSDIAALDRADQTQAVDSPRLEQIDLQAALIERDVARVKKSYAAVGEFSKSLDAFARFRADDDALLQYATVQGKAAWDEFERALVVLLFVLTSTTAGSVLALVLTAAAISGGIARRLGKVTRELTDVTENDVRNLTEAFGRLSSGDVSATFESSRRIIVDDGRDEIAKLAGSYNGLAEGLEIVSLEFNRMTEALISRDIETIVRLTRAAEFRDDVTGMHVIRVGYMCEAVGRTAGLSDEECKRLLLAAPMHDIGKVATPDRILLKPGPLTSSELEVMRQHTIAGYEILKDSQSPMLQCAAEIALSHHERFDGQGYPQRLSGTNIPFSGRLCSVVDVFDALTSVRPYKPAWPLEKALDALNSDSGTHFDPEVVNLFHKTYERIMEIRRNFADAGTSADLIRESFVGSVKRTLVSNG